MRIIGASRRRAANRDDIRTRGLPDTSRRSHRERRAQRRNQCGVRLRAQAPLPQVGRGPTPRRENPDRRRRRRSRLVGWRDARTGPAAGRTGWLDNSGPDHRRCRRDACAAADGRDGPGSWTGLRRASRWLAAIPVAISATAAYEPAASGIMDCRSTRFRWPPRSSCPSPRKTSAPPTTGCGRCRWRRSTHAGFLPAPSRL